MEKYYLEKIPPDKYKTSNLIYKVGYFFNSLHFHCNLNLQCSSVYLIKGAANCPTNSLLKSNPANYIKTSFALPVLKNFKTPPPRCKTSS